MLKIVSLVLIIAGVVGLEPLVERALTGATRAGRARQGCAAARRPRARRRGADSARRARRAHAPPGRGRGGGVALGDHVLLRVPRRPRRGRRARARRRVGRARAHGPRRGAGRDRAAGPGGGGAGAGRRRPARRGRHRRCAATTSTCSAPAGTRRSPRAFAAGRGVVDTVLGELVARVGAPTSAAVTTAVVDGAVVTALTEHRPVRATARALLARRVGHSSPTYA